MSSTITRTYTNDANYIKSDSAKIGTENGLGILKLIDNAGQTFTEDYTNDTGFTYDSTKGEFVGGVYQQKVQIPLGGACCSKFTDSVDLSCSANGGNLTGTAHINAVASGGLLDLTFNDGSFVEYDGLNNIDSLVQFGCVRFTLIPNYDGKPVASNWHTFFAIAQSTASSNNGVQLQHLSDNNLKLIIKNSVGGTLIGVDLGVWSAVKDQSYIFELNWDLTNGATRLFIDGVQFGSTITTVGTRTNNVAMLRLGRDRNTSSLEKSNYKLDNVIFYDSVQHTADHTPDDTIDPMYVEDIITQPAFNYTGLGSLIAFSGFSGVNTNTPKYTLNNQYWDGAAWVASNNSYIQANTVADINTNISSLTAIDTVTPKLITQDSDYKIVVDQLTLTHTGQAYPTTNEYIEFNEYTYMSELISFLTSINVVGSDAVKHTVIILGVSYYWNGSSWAVSSGYAQSNTAAEINTNASSLLSSRSGAKIRTYLHSHDGSTAPSIDYYTKVYDAALPDPTNLPRLIDINGFIYDMNGPCPYQTIKIRPYQKGYQNPNDGVGGGVFQKYAYETVATTDSDGFFSAKVYLQPDGEFIEIKIGRQSYYTQLPDEDEIDFNKLTLTVVQ